MAGGDSPHSSSTSRSLVTGSLARSKKRIRRARCRPAPIDSWTGAVVHYLQRAKQAEIHLGITVTPLRRYRALVSEPRARYGRPCMSGLDRRTLVALVAMAMAVFVVANDLTALSVALPDIEKDFDADVSSVQWVINIYALVFGVLIVTGGRLADMFGRRLIFFIGAGIFALFSVLGAVAPDDLWLIV